MYRYIVRTLCGEKQYDLTLDNLRGIYTALSLYAICKEHVDKEVNIFMYGYKDPSRGKYFIGKFHIDPSTRQLENASNKQEIVTDPLPGNPSGKRDNYLDNYKGSSGIIISFSPSDAYNEIVPYPIVFLRRPLTNLEPSGLNITLKSKTLPIVTDNIEEYLSGILLLETLQNKFNVFYISDGGQEIIHSRSVGFPWNELPRDMKVLIAGFDLCSVYGVNKEFHNIFKTMSINAFSPEKQRKFVESTLRRGNISNRDIELLKEYMTEEVPKDFKVVAFLPESLIRYHYDLISKCANSQEIIFMARANVNYLKYLRILGLEVDKYVLDALQIDLMHGLPGKDKVLYPKINDSIYYMIGDLCINDGVANPRVLGKVITMSGSLDNSITRLLSLTQRRGSDYCISVQLCVLSQSIRMKNIPLISWLLRNYYDPNVNSSFVTYSLSGSLMSEVENHLYEMILYDINNSDSLSYLSDLSQKDYDRIFSGRDSVSTLGSIFESIIFKLQNNSIDTLAMIAIAILKNPYLRGITSNTISLVSNLDNSNQYNLEIKKLVSEKAELDNNNPSNFGMRGLRKHITRRNILSRK
jgi:hypothetical protein